MNGAFEPVGGRRVIPPLPGLAGTLSMGSLLLAAANGETGNFTIQSVTALVTALSGLVIALAAWRRGGDRDRGDEHGDRLSRSERAELARLRREHRRRARRGD